MWNESPLSWATEFESGGGILNDRLLNNEMGFAALELYFDNFLVYAEGGFKYWSTWEDDIQLSKFRTGMREFYINSFTQDYTFKLGLQSIQFQDKFIFNERALAAYYNWKSSGAIFEAALGTVADNFARNGTFCSKCFQYDFVQNRPRPILADNAFEENFMALVLTIDPEKLNAVEASTNSNTGADEFAVFDEFETADEFGSADEFSSNDEFGSMQAEVKKPLAKIDDYGLLMNFMVEDL